METIARNTPQLTLATTADTAPRGLTQKCASVSVKTLKAAGRAYLEGAKYYPCWIGAYWLPNAWPQSRNDGR